MKKLIPLFLFAISLATCTTKHNPSTEQQLLQLLNEKNLFRLKVLLKEKESELSKSIALYLKAHLQNAFNQTEQSLKTLDVLLGKYGSGLNDTLLLNAFLIKYDNLHKQTRYREAAEALEIAMNKYGIALDSVALTNLRETYNSVEPLKEFPPQKMHIATDITIPILRNQFNHVTMKVRKGETSEDFIFDTGAMLSVIAESCAQRMGIRVMESSVNVGNSVGSKVQSKVGVADSLWIGDLLIENVAFLVLPDAMLSFPQANYFIRGIVGFPVMYQMREVTIRKDESITVTVHPTKRNLHNLFLDGLSPFVQLEANSDTVVFHMDTGANTTEFSEKYFVANKDEIVKKATLKTVKQGSAGSIVDTKVYELENILLKVGGQELTVPSVVALSEKKSFLENCDGNLGQDVLMHFNKLILNFEDMYLALED